MMQLFLLQVRHCEFGLAEERAEAGPGDFGGSAQTLADAEQQLELRSDFEEDLAHVQLEESAPQRPDVHPDRVDFLAEDEL